MQNPAARLGNLGKSVVSVHDFQASLEKSHTADELPLWRECYTKMFPNMLSMNCHRHDGWHQRAGIDRSITMPDSKQILIDEKVRFRPYNDIALEYLSNVRTGAKGWVCKPLACDYIAYAVAPLGHCYLLPVIQLQRSWLAYGESWMTQYFKPIADNGTYKTHSVAVPVAVLMRSISEMLYASFTPIERADNATKNGGKLVR